MSLSWRFDACLAAVSFPASASWLILAAWCDFQLTSMMMVASCRLYMHCTQSSLSCRRAVLLNLKYDEEVTSFANAAGAGAANELTAFSSLPKADVAAQQPCTAISFKTGGLHAPGRVPGACEVLNAWSPWPPALLIC